MVYFNVNWLIKKPVMMAEITDEYMMQMRTTTKNYTLMILKAGLRFTIPDVSKIIWEHGRKNFSLRADGLLSVVFREISFHK